MSIGRVGLWSPIRARSFPQKQEMANSNPNPATRFVKGVSPNPGGKPVGARDAINAAFLRALAKDFGEHGPQALADLRESKPDKYIEVIASLLPAEKNVNLTASGKITHEHESVSATSDWIGEQLAARSDSASAKPLPH